MNWTELCITVNINDTETASAICNMAVRSGIYVEDYSDVEEKALEIAHIDLIDEELLNKDKNISVIHMYFSEEDNISEALSFVEEALKKANIKYTLDENRLRDSDWADNWKKYFKATKIGKRLVVSPSWEECDFSDKVILRIDPGAAFGTGTHATTSLCLTLLEKYVKQGDTCLDIGCGSGILSIAACLLGACNSVGVDIDPTSVKVAVENAELNKVSDRAEYFVGNLADKVCGEYNIICANIVADVIINLTSDIHKYMKKDAVYIVSGIIDIRADDVRVAFKNAGLKIIDELKKDNWYAFALKF